jgi:hypothetical protein
MALRYMLLCCSLLPVVEETVAALEDQLAVTLEMHAEQGVPFINR